MATKKPSGDERKAVTVRLKAETMRAIAEWQDAFEAATGIAPSTQDAIERCLVLGLEAARRQLKAR
jgi:hypothetical protein